MGASVPQPAGAGEPYPARCQIRWELPVPGFLPGTDGGGEEGSHHTIRMLICDEIMLNPQDYVCFVDLGDDGLPGTYLEGMRMLGTFVGFSLAPSASRSLQ